MDRDTAAGAGTAPAAAQFEALGREAAGRLVRGRADLARPLLEQLERLAPGHPSVRALHYQVEVIGFDWPARRSPYAPKAGSHVAPGDVDLVAFHVDLPRAPSGVHTQVDYMAVLALAFEAARLRAPRARRVLLTDAHTAVPQAVDAEVVRFEIDRDHLMFERMRVQEAWLRERPAGRASVLMDSDVVVNREPSAIFAEDFDVGLTYRHSADAPFNGGLLLAAPGNGAVAFLRRCLQCYEALASDASVLARMPHDLRSWWGDQFALAIVAGYRAFAERISEGLEVDGMRLRFFPCESHNFTIDPGGRYPRQVLQDKRFIHFKGNRKELLAQYVAAMRSGQL